MSLITITDVIKDSSGDFPTGGTLTFRLSDWMTNAAGKIIVPTNETVNVSSVDGTFTATLESTTDCTPGTRSYAVTFNGTLDGATVTISLGSFTLAATPSSQDLSDLLNTAATPGTGINLASVNLSSTEPRITFTETDQGTNLKMWDIDVNAAVMAFRTRTDADGAGVTWLAVTRGATTSIASIALTGNVVLNTPVSGVALDVSGLNNQWATLVRGSSTTNQSYGMKILAGTSVIDAGFLVSDSTGAANYFYVQGDGLSVAQNSSFTDGPNFTYNVRINDLRSATAGVGGSIAFSGNYTGTSSNALLAGIQGFKENSTSGNFDGGLRFFTRQNGGQLTERVRINSAGQLLGGPGGASLPAVAGIGAETTGLYWISTDTLSITTSGTQRAYFNNSGLVLSSAYQLSWSGDANLVRIAADVIAMKRTAPQEFRIFGDATTKYTKLSHDGTETVLGNSNGDIYISPTTNITSIINGNSAQELRVYGTTTGPKYTSVSNDGTTGYVSLPGDSPLAISINASSRWAFQNSSSAYSLIPQADNSYDIGSSSLRSRSIYAGTSVNVADATNTVGNLYIGKSAGGVVFVTDYAAADASSANWYFRKARGSQTALADAQNGDTIGQINFDVRSTSYFDTAVILAKVDGTFTSGQRPPSRIERYTNIANGAQSLRESLLSTGAVRWTGDATADWIFNNDKTSTSAGGVRIRSNTNDTHFIADLGAFSGVGAFGLGAATSSQMYVLVDQPALTSGSNLPFSRVSISNNATVTIPASTTSAFVTTLNLEEPNITLGASAVVNDAYTLRINGAPTEATRNGALWVTSGAVRIDSTLQFGTNASTSGVIQMANNTGINWRNAANNANLTGIYVDTSNNLHAGQNFTFDGFGSFASYVKIAPVTVANLPASPTEGMLVPVTDSNTSTFNAVIAGGGAQHVLAFYNGTNWTVH